MGEKLTPQDILEAIQKDNSEVSALRTIVRLQKEIIETQRETIGFQKTTIESLREILAIEKAIAKFQSKQKSALVEDR